LEQIHTLEEDNLALCSKI